MPDNPILTRMLDRLYGSLVSGPGLNCRPHRSRQRIDLTLISRFKDVAPHTILQDLLGESQKATAEARVPTPPDIADQRRDPRNIHKPGAEDEAADHPEDDPAHRDWRLQRQLLNKLRNLSDDARTYEQDTGIAALYLGYPILSLPPGSLTGTTSRILAPVAFIPISLAVRTGHRAGVDIACRAHGIDRVVPNPALLAWLERQTGKPADELFDDEEGDAPWQEIETLVRHVATTLEIATEAATFGETDAANLVPVPRAEDLPQTPAIYAAAVLGLFPMTNQSLLRDMQEMIAADSLEGPVGSFVTLDAALRPTDDPAEPDASPAQVEPKRHDPARQRMIALADPFQSRAVELARESTGLVVHGPPGTGKSQTIVNIIGDHLARGQRVLFVCDKRTALDVVHHRLRHLGLGPLCALVHDPQRDQRDLYMAIRAELEDLANAQTDARAGKKLDKLDRNLTQLHEELTAHHDALMAEHDGDPSFHELVGQWMAIESPHASLIDEDALGAITTAALDDAEPDMRLIFDWAAQVDHASNPWSAAAGMPLETYLRQPVHELRRRLASCAEDARAADASRHPATPPFEPDAPLDQQVRQRTDAAKALRAVLDGSESAATRAWLDLKPDAVKRTAADLDNAAMFVDLLADASPDPELQLVARELEITPGAVAHQIATLDEYIASLASLLGFLRFGARRRGKALLRTFALPPSIESAVRLRAFLSTARARFVLRELLDACPAAADTSTDDATLAGFRRHRAIAHLLTTAAQSPPIDAAVRAALADADPDAARRLLEGLDRSADRAEALARLDASLRGLALFTDAWLESASALARAGHAVTDSLKRLIDRFDTLEPILRINDALGSLPAPLRKASQRLLAESAEPDDAAAAIRKAVTAAALRARVQSSPLLTRLDATKLAATFDRYRKLEHEKLDLARRATLHRWKQLQRDRLLVSTGSRLNGDGARLRQRLYVRGRRAMRLRQVIAVGRQGEQNDPLFDICPVWMASPETVAQVLPRTPLFDLVIFDEASQCKLEEALPVLTRAKRVVIAGDPKQLPPTRFFEAAIATSDNAELESDQDLFEAQQAEIEDLLAAALNLEIDEAYLDVHYRSRNADLIEFSNRQFYGSRLQAIPGHPAHAVKYAPITLHRAEGVYENRCNPIEAQRVCNLVRDLLRRAEPPSIGIATFNLSQRDLIVEMLDDMAEQDPRFAARLAEARKRQGDGSFEGLFVKNLENVQGDERDHIIISTTYGPNPQGRFYRRFGPLGTAGGGRRLNVLVTRARHEIHLVTSIPTSAYRHVESLPTGAAPNGVWLLFAYMRYAEDLATAYGHPEDAAEDAEPLASTTTEPAPAEPAAADTPDPTVAQDAPGEVPADDPDDTGEFDPDDTADYDSLDEDERDPDDTLRGTIDDALAEASQEAESRDLDPDDIDDDDAPFESAEAPDDLDDDDIDDDLDDDDEDLSPGDLDLMPDLPSVIENEIEPVSTFPIALAHRLAAEHDLAACAHWGNEGFRIDMTLTPHDAPDGATLGVLCDFSRFRRAADPVQWDLFRTAIHESQGWKLHRLWSPQFFRDPRRANNLLLADLEQAAQQHQADA